MKSAMKKMMFYIARRVPIKWTVGGGLLNCLSATALFPDFKITSIIVCLVLFTVGVTFIFACKGWERFYYRKHRMKLAFERILDLSCNNKKIESLPVEIRHTTEDKLTSYDMSINGDDNFVDVHFFLSITEQERSQADEFIAWQEGLPRGMSSKDLGIRNLAKHSYLHSYKQFSMFDFNHNYDVTVQAKVKDWERIIEKFRVYCYYKNFGIN